MPFDPRVTPLTAVQARVLATLMEKARTVPDCGFQSLVVTDSSPHDQRSDMSWTPLQKTWSMR